MKSELVRLHHADYVEDIPFWIKTTESLDPVLEIGPGHGRVILPLLAAGHELVGVDHDKESFAYLEKILNEVDDEIRQRISLVQTDILDYQPPALFGGVIIPCNTYSTFSSEDKPRLIRKVYSWLKDGGQFIFSLPNPSQTAEIMTEQDMSDGPDLEKMIIHPETGFPVQISSRLRVADHSLWWEWIYDHLHPNGQVERFVVSVEHFLVSQEEILTELEVGGFKNVDCLGDFNGENFTESSPYLILICRK